MRGRNDTNSEEARAAGLRVLVAEDEPLVRQILSTMLRFLGCEATFVRDGEAAVRDFAASLAGPAPYDLVLMDLTMPRMDGVAATRALRGMAPDVRVIAMTGFVAEYERARSKENGFGAWLDKPFTLEELRAAMTAVLGRDRAFTPASGPSADGRPGPEGEGGGAE